MEIRRLAGHTGRGNGQRESRPYYVGAEGAEGVRPTGVHVSVVQEIQDSDEVVTVRLERKQ